MDLPVLVTSQLTFDTGSDKLVKGESAIVIALEDEEWGGGGVWVMLSIDRPRIIRHHFHQAPPQVLKRWLKPDA